MVGIRMERRESFFISRFGPSGLWRCPSGPWRCNELALPPFGYDYHGTTFHQKLNGTESQRTPDQVSCDRAIRYSGETGSVKRWDTVLWYSAIILGNVAKSKDSGLLYRPRNENIPHLEKELHLRTVYREGLCQVFGRVKIQTMPCHAFRSRNLSIFRYSLWCPSDTPMAMMQSTSLSFCMWCVEIWNGGMGGGSFLDDGWG